MGAAASSARRYALTSRAGSLPTNATKDESSSGKLTGSSEGAVPAAPTFNTATRDLQAVIRDRVEAMAERNAQARRAVHPKLSIDELFKLKPKERILEELRIKPAEVEVTTTFAFTIRWDYLYVAGEKQAQMTVVEALLLAPESQSCTISCSLDASPENIQEILLPGASWTLLPDSVLDKNKRTVYIGDVSSTTCPGICFRVRARHAVGWGDWSAPSQAFAPLVAERPPPTIVFHSDASIYEAKVDWSEHACLPSFGQLIFHKLFVCRHGDISPEVYDEMPRLQEMGYIMTSNEKEEEVYAGREWTTVVGCKINQVGLRGFRSLLPGVEYSFRLETQMGLSRGDRRYNSLFKSREIVVKVPCGSPIAPSPCVASRVSPAGIQLDWTPPICNGGAQVLRFQVFCEVSGDNQSEEREQDETQPNDHETHCCFEGNLTSIYYGESVLRPGQRYGFRVVAINEFGNSPPSQTTWVRVPTVEEERQNALAERTRQEREAERSRALQVSTGTASQSVESHEIMASPDGMVDLPEGWNEYWDPASEELFYYNVYTGQNQWEKPSFDDTALVLSQTQNYSPEENPEERDWRLFRKKRFRFLHQLHRLRKQDLLDETSTFRLSVRRKHLVSDSLARLERFGIEALLGKLQIVFEGEAGIDSGGLSKDWFLAFTLAILQPEYGLFQRTPSGTYALDSRAKLIPEAMTYLRIFGAVCGKALYDQQLVNAPLCTDLLRSVTGDMPDLANLRERDEILAKSLQWILENDIENIIEETFTVGIELFGAFQEVELIPGGANVPVTNQNKEEYVQEVIKYHCGGAVQELVQSWLEGIWTLVPKHFLHGFSATELRLLLNGKTEIRVEDLRFGCTHYSGGYTSSSDTVELFWTVMEGLEQADRARVLRFATGCDRVPLDGFSPLLPFTITKSEFDKDALPTSHTCFHQLVLPPYESAYELREKLLYACDHAMGFEMS